MPDVDPSLYDLPKIELIPGQKLSTDNIAVRIKDFVATASIPIAVRLSTTGFANIDVEIVEPTIAAPTDAYAIHLESGTVMLTWKHSEPEKVDYYEVSASDSLNGTYTPYNQAVFRKPRGVVANVPIGISAYFRVRAFGKNGAVSSSVQVMQGKFENPMIGMKVRAIYGSRIKSGAIFSATDNDNGMLVGIQAEDTIPIQ